MKKKTGLHECTNYPDAKANANFMGLLWRKKLIDVKGQILQFCASSRLIDFVRQHQNTAKHVASGTLAISLTK